MLFFKVQYWALYFLVYFISFLSFSSPNWFHLRLFKSTKVSEHKKVKWCNILLLVSSIFIIQSDFYKKLLNWLLWRFWNINGPNASSAHRNHAAYYQQWSHNSKRYVTWSRWKLFALDSLPWNFPFFSYELREVMRPFKTFYSLVVFHFVK